MQALERSVAALDNALASERADEASLCGATITLIMAARQWIVAAWVGDSEAVHTLPLGPSDP